ncbi:di-glucose binding protein with Kinesin motor domain [Striga asiatica]|uniref:Di-glucose binding protein with Kinesin motor domain n=1 Tax=Striga asiatica TaxID=4170 RepID=A0A5A7PVN7_STRAF|nr:di-glucose binding protein with Kinesin motor domain [Striga asiatica]
MVAWMARAGALSGAYSLSDDSSFLISCFSRLANCFDSLHGVSPEMSADAGSTGADRTIEDRASAAENAFSWEEEVVTAAEGSSELARHTTTAAVALRGFPADMGVEMDLEKEKGFVAVGEDKVRLSEGGR